MLPYVLVLLLAQSAFGASSGVSLNLQNIQDTPYPVERSNSPVSSYLVRPIFELLDQGETTVYVNLLQTIVSDLADKPDTLSQALAVCATTTVVGELASGRPGDGCPFAELINAYVDSLKSGNKAGLKRALENYVRRVDYNIDAIVSYNSNDEALRYQSGPRGKCSGGGRSYQFESSWNLLFSAVNPFQVGLVNEEYCVAKRLYHAWSEVNNLVGAAVTACGTQPVIQLFERALLPNANFLRQVVRRGNVVAAAAQAKASLAQALSQA